MKHIVRTGMIWSGVCVAGMLAILAYAWFSLPRGESIPIHWNAQGQADDYAGFLKAMAILALPVGIALVTNIIMMAVPVLAPRAENMIKSAKVYLTAWIGSNLLIVAITGLIAWSMITRVEDDSSTFMGRFIIASVCIFMIAIGNLLPKSRSNFFVGIRTPWTLSSDYAWEKTHRLGSKLFVLSGVMGLPFAIFAQQIWLQMVVVPLLLATAIITVVYSYIVWRDAPDRT